jgi:hypothetical protein
MKDKYVLSTDYHEVNNSFKKGNAVPSQTPRIFRGIALRTHAITLCIRLHINNGSLRTEANLVNNINK